ncbi:electron transfer flavoprotein subunit alpha/FixB family protein [Natronobacterium gregoryi]|uniref:Electron transfer flavoprotein subunit alpha n=2 Tax=Natronobacterium gregoryi TaxID=44930 RepID=L0ACN9_NATGS|nr:electron transfer flavoprotein subunit alpha/FixB family protein [Natronobacterium gregoryi]AFZ71601.1 electron transfer flavoprotein, alpha subunit [Natronobacterium gregoryi SP2]ELY66656.1 electron transfer flavoprotein subunit alpha [Natronobacterium gregoryi SP2]PLK21368.1 electron transfer flavoprotein subunit alpha/FixB family protein [Natronobacterium gregoryi SP2]SFI80738.1 electron transfer flavoprotein alpha subunit apoprotein [Natronobacterium gregoryi]
MTIDPDEHTVDELEEELETIDDEDTLQSVMEAEQAGRDRKTAREAIHRRLEAVGAVEGESEELEGDTETEGEYEETKETVGEQAEGEEVEEVDADSKDEPANGEEDEQKAESEEEDDGLSHPTRDKRHVRALEDGHYEDMWVFCETQGGELLDISKEMLGKARRLMDDFAEENVVAFLMGDDCEGLAEECIAYGADVAVYHDDERLERFLHKPYTEISAHMARGEGPVESTDWRNYDEPRYALFPATNNGRDLSAKVQAELDSGLASDCSDLFIEANEVSNPVKTGEPGVKKTFEKVLHMKRPDFSGFEYSTILCLDNPGREFHPQGASVIPGSFDPIEPDYERDGLVVEHEMDLEDDWFCVEITESDQLEAGIDLTGHEVIVCLGRGIADDPTEGMELGLDLVDAFEDAELGITRGIVTSSYQFEGHVEEYSKEERQIGETGQVVAPDLYVAAGVSGAVQHKVGMDESDTIVAINTDTDARIRDFSDYFLEGDLFEVLPQLSEAIEAGETELEAIADGSGADADANESDGETR